ncbi:MAG: hypothetical protein WCV92_03665 [Candidatus Buchananbacteria bacterium]
MESKRKYEPTPEDFAKAEACMTDEQRETTEIRVANLEQVRPIWEESFEDRSIDSETKRRKPPTPEEIKMMDSTLEELAGLFKDSKVRWILDGAMNISLLSRKYIGAHKDTDISIEKDDVELLEQELFENGYGLFLSTEENSSHIMRRVGAHDFAKANPSHLMIVAIDKNGKIHDDVNLNFIDVHIVARNSEGQAISKNGTVLPEKWMEPIKMKLGDKSINVSHPARVAYYKMLMEREYDFTDLDRLAETGSLTADDVDEISVVFQSDFNLGIEKGEKDMAVVFSKMEPGMTADQVFEIFLSIPAIAERINPESESTYRNIAEVYVGYYENNDDRSASGMLKALLEHYGIYEREADRQEKIANLKRAVQSVIKK